MSGEAIKRQQSLVFLNTGTTGAEKWAWVNQGVEEFGIDFNEDVERRHYIGNKNSDAVGGTQEKSTSVTQFAHKGDEVFDYIDDIMFHEKQGAEATSELLEVFVYRAEGDALTDIPAKKSKVLITKGSHGGGGGEQLQIEYGIEFIGDPTFVKVALGEDNTITITPEV